MIQRPSQVFHQARDAFRAAVDAPAKVKDLRLFLQQSQYFDPLLLLQTEDALALFPVSHGGRQLDFDNWVLSIESWRQSYLTPPSKAHPAGVLYELWQYYQQSLEKQLQNAKEMSIIPSTGGILAFVGGLSRCLVIDYEFAGNRVQLVPIALIPDPRSLFDFWGTIDRVTPMAQNALKQIVASGHKLVYHRGTLVHVDRRMDVKVFGPTIDTVLLGEVLVQFVLEEMAFEVSSALEVGSGSGLLSAVLARNSPHLKHLIAVDSDFASVACTHKNCSLVVQSLKNPVEINYFNGFYSPAIFKAKVDLCICNPPYIPIPPESRSQTTPRLLDNRRATGGTRLMELVVENITEILKPAGKLLLITSSLSLDVVNRRLPTDFGIERPLGTEGFRVIFDVDSVLPDQEWIKFLTDRCGLQQEGGTYYHNLHPLLIARARLD